MSSVELSKLPGIAAPRALSASDRAQIEARPRATAAAPSPGTPGGISVEVTGGPETLGPPIDADRVQQIREALRDGSYPLVPTKIADAMIAAQVSLALPDKD
ncbi:flagellar biosynthesis anti-sigma factor FlgM [Erythrobacter sp. BLCC-B19]|uniref:flagellar biosynthesis anti-sigma factor FlgM n=1 Tax=Erythrobacter sp. BLCC-B19 TaxID=3025315 RepID=UPI00235EF0F0|nr:flagellar biosynthesis anti-sigma factor FlgM [Erythrobacter sp. BLCC-B19]WDA42000.1 flagellar biosynthesis anti-sigma factor FlgM [Erythrobacter sp. BLCC-B19]